MEIHHAKCYESNSVSLKFEVGDIIGFHKFSSDKSKILAIVETVPRASDGTYLYGDFIQVCYIFQNLFDKRFVLTLPYDLTEDNYVHL